MHPNAALKPWDATPPLARVGSHGSTHTHPTLAASRSGNDVHLALPLPCDDRHVALRRMEAAVAEAAPSWRSRFSGWKPTPGLRILWLTRGSWPVREVVLLCRCEGCR